MWRFRLQHHFGGGSSSTTVQSYTPTTEEKRLWSLEADYQEAAMPYMVDLLQTSQDLKNANNYGTIGADFGALNQNATNLISQAQTGVQNLANGVLPTAYTDNMQAVLNNSVKTAMGTQLNNLATNGVLNSSVTNTALNDISKNAANTMAEQYTNNISTLNGLYGQLDSMAGDQITSTAAAQEAALSPMLSILSASQGGSSNNTSAIGALKGSGTTTSTQNTSSNTGLLGSLLGGAYTYSTIANASKLAACFTAETPIVTDDGRCRKICDIEVGDKILAYDKSVYDFVDSKVLEKTETMNVRCLLIDLWVEDGDFSYDDYIITTPEQSFLTPLGIWFKAKDLKEGDKLLGNKDEKVKVTGISEAGHCTVYDLKLEGVNAYGAGPLIANGMLKEGE